MEQVMSKITVESQVKAPMELVWSVYNNPSDIEQWNTASPDWHTVNSKNDLRVGGQFSNRMEAKDGSMGFDFAGTYTEIIPHEKIAYSFGERNAEISFEQNNDAVVVRIIFDPETMYPIEQQRAGWQAILDNFARYVESGI
jgi:uncharacterized protein YndB with AHSA1/START domain